MRLLLIPILAAPLAAQAGRLPTCDSPVNAAATSPAVVPVTVYHNHVYVKVCVGGRDVDFIFDTGAGATLIDLNLAKRLGLSLGDAFRVGGIGAGSSAANRVNNAALTIAGTGLTQPLDYALDLHPLSRAMRHVLDGVLGYDFISRNIVGLDYVAYEMRLYDRRTFRYRGTGVSLPLTFIGQKPYVDAEIKLADGGTVRGRFLIDVGSNSGLSLAKPFVDDNHLRTRVGALVYPPSTGGVGGFTSMVAGRAAALRLGGLEILNPSVELFGDSAGMLSERGPSVGMIGGDILNRYIVIFDYQAKVMILELNPAAK